MRVSTKGIKLIKDFEGCTLRSYRDSVGVLTIGVGHTGPDVFPNQTITQDQADTLLVRDLAWVEGVIRDSVHVGLTQDQYDALASLIFNIGGSAFKKSTLVGLINRSQYAEAGEQFTRWNRAGGQVLPGLTRRREAERALFLGSTPKAGLVSRVKGLFRR